MRTLLLALSLLLPSVAAQADPAAELAAAAKAQIGVTVFYDPSYQRIRYPGGDVPPDRGVCTDVVIRAYRKIGLDLQELVHRDMARAWPAYPHPAKWGMKAPDPNIDHRRVPNLEAFFARQGARMPVSTDPRAYRPGDIVVWRLPFGLQHIGIVADALSARGTPLVVHNIGAGARMDDLLFAYEITAHFRYAPARATPAAR